MLDIVYVVNIQWWKLGGVTDRVKICYKFVTIQVWKVRGD